jgi:hypothetical protein
LHQSDAHVLKMVQNMMESFRPEDVVGKHYEHGMLPYGGGVSMKTGRVVFATSHEEHKRIMEYLRSLE